MIAYSHFSKLQKNESINSTINFRIIFKAKSSQYGISVHVSIMVSAGLINTKPLPGEGRGKKWQCREINAPRV
jgi:hypothetical protein